MFRSCVPLVVLALTTAFPAAAQSPQYMPTTLAPVVEKALPAVVNISATRTITTSTSPFASDPFFRYFFGGDPFGRRMPQERREQSLGSGVIVSPDGLVITNDHVVRESGEVQVYWNETPYEATVVGHDSKTDVALLKIESDEPFPYLPFGDSDALRVGDFVLAIGNPFGLDQTVTMGIVSAVGRADVGVADYEDFIQTDAAINPGNSGGALLNLEGELIGINTAILSRSGGYQGIGFAIPSRMAERVIESLQAHGEVRRGWIGVAVQDLTDELAAALGLAGAEGVLVSDVFDASPADRAGIRQGDIVVEVDGKRVTNVGQYRTRTERMLPGMSPEITVVRDGARRTFEVDVQNVPDEPDAQRFEDFQSSVLPGLALETLDPATAQRLGFSRRSRGVLITDVRKGGAAERAGLRPGDVVVEIDRVRVGTLADVEKVVSRSSDAKVLLLVQRGRRAYYVVLPRNE